ncbi:MAG: class I SAM-dependent methyltransferase [Rhizobiaceae bacterium]|nr:class I SAM-dependent methyltransferase [Rhizobiaceae bacterium]
MSSEAEQNLPSARRASPVGFRVSILRRLVGNLDVGSLTVRTPSGQTLAIRSPNPGPDAEIRIHRWRALRRLVFGGDIAFAEAYVDGDWSSPDVELVIELAARNLDALERNITATKPVRWLNRLRHLLRANDRKGSRRNIAYHYDIGNAFYRLWLDRSMTYSAALYEKADLSLEEAQDAKLARIVELLELKPGMRVLEIGCGWGALAARIAHKGAAVTGLTLSREQHDDARALADREGVTEKVDIVLRDYRDERASYDRIVSIEMIEAVGEAFWPDYFRTLRDRLNAGGRAVLQAITIDESRYANYRAEADFIQRHIFPGGMLPTKTIIADQARRAGLALTYCQTFGLGYALTLAEWRRRFLQAWPAIERQQGFGIGFCRLWEYYLAYCEAGFRAGTIDVGLYVLEPARR